MAAYSSYGSASHHLPPTQCSVCASIMFPKAFLLLLIGSPLVLAIVPDYIHVCKRSDPKVEECVLNSIEELRPRLRKGLPELQVPPIEPLLIDEVEVANGQDATRLRIYGRNILVKGASDFIIDKLKLDLTNDSSPTIYVSLTLPKLDLDGNYELNAKLLLLPLKGKGQIHVNATNIKADAVVHSQIVKKEDATTNIIRFHKVDMQLDMEDYDITLANLFSGEPTLSEVANRIIRENKVDFGKTLNPIISKTVGRVIIDVANKIAKDASYDDLFPL